MSSGLLGGLAGIDEAKNVHVRDKTTLEKLLELEHPFVDYYLKGMDEIQAKVKPIIPDTKRDKLKEVLILEKLFPEFEKRVTDIHFDETDLVSYVRARYNDSDHTRNELKARGLYSGFLLNLLTKRYESEGRKAIIHIDGKGSRFDFLFYLAQNVHELYIENLKGDYTCHYLGYKGEIDKLVMRNIQGRDTCTCIGVKGNSNKVICANISNPLGGSSPFEDVFVKGYCNLLILSNIDGSLVLNFRNVDNRSCNTIICDNINGKKLLEQRLDIDNLGLIVLNELNIGGDEQDTASSDIRYFGLSNMDIDTILFSNVPEDIATYLNGLYTISALKVYSPPEPEYDSEMKQYRMPEIMNLLKKFREGEKDMRTFMAEFDKVYTSVEPEIQKLSSR